MFSGYVENWENARFNQHSLKITTEEQDLLNEIDEYQKKQIIEKIVTDEICAYYQENIKNMENEMLEWSDQYDQEMEKRQRDIDNLKVFFFFLFYSTKFFSFLIVFFRSSER